MVFHHVALSVRSLDDSQSFYEKLGFKEVHRWDAENNSLTIVHLKLGSVVLELFAYAKSQSAQQLNLEVANNLEEVGLKHIGLNVSDVSATFNSMREAGYQMGNPAVKHGRTNIDYFFVKDPDGVWVEIVQDDRGY